MEQQDLRSLLRIRSCVLVVVLLAAAAGGRDSRAEAAVLEYDWVVGYLAAAPDCVQKMVIAINGQFPAPTIHAVEGDTLVVKLKNNLPTEGVSIHWHGIHQRGTPFYDGSAFISQCPINPGETFTYKFVVDRAGTYFYHGHLAMQRVAGLFGLLIVSLPSGKTEPFSYDGGDLSVLLSDWYHKSIYQQELGLSSIPFQFVGEPQSLLIQGRGKYNCSLDLPPGGSAASSSPDCLQCNATNPACAPFVLPVQPGKTYRLRIGSMATLSSLNFKIENHNLTVVAADGRYVEPFVVDNLDVYSGQSYSVLLTANQDPTQNYWVGVNVRGRKPATPTGLAILQYLPNSERLLPPTPAPMGPVWNDFAVSVAQAQKYSAKKGLESAPPTTSHKLLIFLMTQSIINGYTRWAVNNISQVPSATPLLAAFKFKLWSAFDQTPPPRRPPQYTNNKHFDIFATPNPNTTHASLGNGVYVSKLGEVVDIVIQNTNTLVPNNSEIHPWHFHGHDFWVLGYGEGVFDPRNSTKTYNLLNPPLRNTVAVFPYGWVAIRFIADNPGVWPFHCHVEPHLFVGMGTVFAEGIHKLPHIPSQTLGCGLTKPTRW
ncbi:unnamed protein product [Sphagnum tenellum]